MSDNTEYYVERILRRKMQNDEPFYLIKWEGYSSSYNTWEPAENITGCDELMNDFHQERAHEITAIRQVGDRIEYLIRQKDNWPSAVVASAVAAVRWPILVFQFLERQMLIQFDRMQQNAGAGVQINESQTTGVPIRVTYATNVGGRGEINYWCEWPQQAGRFVGSGELLANWPRLAIDYLESKVSFQARNNDVQDNGRYNANSDYFVGMQIVTRGQKSKILPTGFDRNVAVRITRNIDFDLVLLNKPTFESPGSDNRRKRRKTIGGNVNPIAPQKSILKRNSVPAIGSTTTPPSTSSGQPSGIMTQRRNVRFLIAGSPSTSSSAATATTTASSSSGQPSGIETRRSSARLSIAVQQSAIVTPRSKFVPLNLTSTAQTPPIVSSAQLAIVRTPSASGSQQSAIINPCSIFGPLNSILSGQTSPIASSVRFAIVGTPSTSGGQSRILTRRAYNPPALTTQTSPIASSARFVIVGRPSTSGGQSGILARRAYSPTITASAQSTMIVSPRQQVLASLVQQPHIQSARSPSPTQLTTPANVGTPTTPNAGDQ